MVSDTIRRVGASVGSRLVTDPVVDPARPQDRVTELAAALAELLGPERDSEITAHLARVAARRAADPLPALDAAHRALIDGPGDRKSTRLNSSHYCASRMTSSA